MRRRRCRAGPSRAVSSWPRAAAPESTPARLGRSVPRNRTVRFAVLGNSVQRTAASGYPSSRSSALKRRIVVGGLIALSLVLITVSFRSSALDGVQGTAAGILRPVRGRRRSRLALRSATRSSWFHGLADAKSENAKLRKQVDTLREQLVLDESCAAGERPAPQGSSSSSARRRSRTSTGGTRLSSTNPQSALDESITIAAGTHDGIRAGDPVIDDSGGLVGTIDRAWASVARVTLLTQGQNVTATDLTNPAAVGVIRSGSGGALIFDRVPKAPNVAGRQHRHHRRLARQGRAAVDLPARAPDRDGLERQQQRRRHVQDDPGRPVRRLLVAAVGDRARAASAPRRRLIDAVKAACVLFVAALLQLSVLTEYRAFRTSSIVLVALLSIALLRGSIFGAARRVRHRAAARHGDARHARRHLAAADDRRLLDRPLRRDDRARPLPRAVRLGRRRDGPLLVRPAVPAVRARRAGAGQRRGRARCRSALLINLLLTLPVYALVRRLFPPQQIGDRVREVRLLG